MKIYNWKQRYIIKVEMFHVKQYIFSWQKCLTELLNVSRETFCFKLDRGF